MNFVSVADFCEHAEQVVTKNAFDYYRSGAGDEKTLEWNKTAFEKYLLKWLFFTKIILQLNVTTIIELRFALEFYAMYPGKHLLAMFWASTLICPSELHRRQCNVWPTQMAKWPMQEVCM